MVSEKREEAHMVLLGVISYCRPSNKFSRRLTGCEVMGSVLFLDYSASTKIALSFSLCFRVMIVEDSAFSLFYLVSLGILRHYI